MKFLILLALIAFAAALPAEDKKEKIAEDKKPVTDEKKPAQDEKKPAQDEKKEEEHHGLQWPLPDPINEGDLMLHGFHLFERVNELRKAKLENDVDKMVLAVGRDYLRGVHKYLEKQKDFKIISILCRDSIALNNATRRWEIRLRPEHQPTETKEAKEEKKETEGEKQNDVPLAGKIEKPKDTNLTTENVTETPILDKKPAVETRETYEARRVDHYERMGDNFARLLLKKWRKEKMIEEETEYLDQWIEDAAVHYGTMAIYCRDGENIKEIIKRINTMITEKE
jgi:hypothetical protein